MFGRPQAKSTKSVDTIKSHSTCRDARSSARKRRTNERLSICYVYKRAPTAAYGWVVRWCGRSNERPYCQGVDIACVTYYSLVRCLRGRHKTRPLQLAMVWCGRSNELARPAQGAATTVDMRCLTDACGRSNERPYCQGVDYCMRYILFACSLLARPAQDAATTTGDGLVRTLERACEAGTRRGHYSGYALLDRRLRTLERASLLSGGWILACVIYYSLVRWVRGRHKARPLQWIFVDCLRLRTLERASLRSGGVLHALHPHSPTLIFTSPYTQPWH